jgi:pimeloyl-ACP methyl ester carboxylesterase
MPHLIRNRRVYLLTGYEPLGPGAHHHRFQREIKRFEKTWSLAAEVGPMSEERSGPVASWQVALRGPDFATQTDIRLLRWDDIVAEDMQLPLWKRLPRYLGAAGDILLTGTFFRYIRAYWRYSLFAGYPAVLLMVFLGLAYAGGALWTALGLPYALAARLVLGVAIFAGLMRFTGERFHMNYMLSDWIFARDMIRQRRPAVEERMEAFAREIAAGVKAGDVDEVVVIAHSLGAVWMVGSLARALSAHPDLASGPVPLGLAGVGSSTLKIALHPAAAWLRDAVQRVADTPAVTWAEYDSHVDFICFYKNNTVEALGLATASRPATQSIRLSRMLSPETWGRFRGNLLRVHRQYVMGNEQRYAYDFHMIACGPFRFADIVHHGQELPAALGPDGSLGGATVRFPSAPGDASAQ